MSGKYNFKIQKGTMIFGVDGCDSFDEAIKKVERGVYDWELEHPTPRTPVNTPRIMPTPIIKITNPHAKAPTGIPSVSNTDNTADDAREKKEEPESKHQ